MEAEKEEICYQCLFEACKSISLADDGERKAGERKASDIRGLYIYGAKMQGKTEEKLDVMLQPEILREAVKETGCLIIANAFRQVHTEDKDLKAELEELAESIQNAADAVKYHPLNLFTELKKHRDSKNQFIQRILDRQEKEFPYPYLEIGENDDRDGEVRPIKSIQMLEFPEGTSVETTLVPPYIIYKVNSYKGKYFLSNTVYIQEIFSGRIVNTWYTPWVIFSSDGTYLYCVEDTGYTIRTLPEFDVVWEGEHVPVIDGIKCVYRPFGKNGKIYDNYNKSGDPNITMRIGNDDLPWPFVEQRLYQMNGGEDGHTPILCGNMVPDFEREREHCYFDPVRTFLDQCYAENNRACGKLVLKDYKDNHVLYEHDLNRMCNNISYIEDSQAHLLFLITYCWEQEPMQNEIRVLKMDDSGEKYEVVCKRDISHLFGKLHQAYFAINGRLYLQSPDKSFMVLNEKLEEIGSGVMKDALSHYDPNRPWHMKEYGEYLICNTNQFGSGTGELHIYRKEDFLKIYENAEDKKLQGNFCFEHEGKGYWIDKESSSVWSMDLSSGETKLFAENLPVPCQEWHRYAEEKTGKVRFWGVARAKVMTSRMLLYSAYEPDNNVCLEQGGTIIPENMEVEDAIWTPSGFYYFLREEEAQVNEPVLYGVYVIHSGEKKGTRMFGVHLIGREGRNAMFRMVSDKPILLITNFQASENRRAVMIVDVMQEEIIGGYYEDETSESRIMSYCLNDRGENVFLRILERDPEWGRSFGKQLYLRHLELKNMEMQTLNTRDDEVVGIQDNLAFLAEKKTKGEPDTITIYDMENIKFVQEFAVPFGLNQAANTLIIKNDQRYLFRKLQSGDSVVTIFDENGKELVTQPLDTSCMPLQAGPADVIPYRDGGFSPGIIKIR